MGFDYLKGSVIAGLLAIAQPVLAQEATVLKIGVAAGGGYDTVGRVMARHMGKHLGESGEIPVQNVVGASSLNLVKELAAGGGEAELGMALASLLLNAKLDPANVDVDFSSFKWIGSLTGAESICLTGKDTGIATFQDFISKDFKVGATTAVGGFYQIAALVKNIFGAKYEIVTGFEGLREMEAAIDRGEIAGYCGSQLDAFLRNNQQDSRAFIGGMTQDVTIAGATVPSILSAVTKPEDVAAVRMFTLRDAVYYPVMMAPSVSDETVAKYRAAFDAMLADPDFQAEMTGLYGTISPKSGAEVEAIVADIGGSDAAKLAHLVELLK